MDIQQYQFRYKKNLREKIDRNSKNTTGLKQKHLCFISRKCDITNNAIKPKLKRACPQSKRFPMEIIRERRGSETEAGKCG